MKIKFFFKGSFTNSKVIHCGVPHSYTTLCNCLGPLLFSIFTNDLPLCTKNVNIGMYAEDNTVYCADILCNELTANLNDSLNYVFNWVNENKTGSQH